MNHNGHTNLSTIFRRNLDAHAQDGTNITQKFPHEKYEKTERSTSVFLVDQKYTLNLDELV